ncbi:hypothetical protein [Motilibacter aurantiacus]|uniref:hypothetical protein n=1 Tax=Motilibacter aurantiacus TaxID=2714955 RepID=UPI00140BEA42|nr:hypothetical protein [Motilibacter aurantiacus]NHC44099.1 hypothetical protein [Motilibacter aurantiacus]
MSRPDPFDAFDAGVDEVLRRGLGRLADESPRYVDAQELSAAVLTRARHDRASRRLAVTAAAMVPVAALAGWALGVADRGGVSGGGNLAGGAAASASPFLASPSPSPTLPPSVLVVPTAPAPGATAGTGTPGGTAPVPTGPPEGAVGPPVTPTTPPSPVTTPTAPAAPTPSSSASSTPSSAPPAGPQAMAVTLAVEVTGATVTWRVSWSGGSDPVASVSIYDGDERLSQRSISDDCTLAPAPGVAEGVVDLAKAGTHQLRAWVTARGCDGDVTRRSDTAVVTIEGGGPTATPTATPTPTPSDTGTPSPSPTAGRAERLP